MSAPRILWQPSPERIERAAITQFARARGLPEEYEALWRWSVEDIEGFWGAIWEHYGVAGTYDRVLGPRAMPGAEWFAGAQVSYAEHLFGGKNDGEVAIRHASELRELGEWTWGELRRETCLLYTSPSPRDS